MAITLKELGEYLEKMEYPFEAKEDKSEIYYGVKDNGNLFRYLIRLRENGELFQLYGMLPIDDDEIKASPNKLLFMLYLLKGNALTKIGSWEFDDQNGLIFSVEIPIEDGTLTFKQFARIVRNVAGRYIYKELPNLKYVLEKGEFPKEEASATPTVPPELLADFLEFLKAKKAAEEQGAKQDSI